MPRISSQEVEAKINKTLVKVFGGKVDITPDTILADDLGMDSYASLELMFELEDELGIKIPDKDAKNLKTVGDVYKYITELVSTKE